VTRQLLRRPDGTLVEWDSRTHRKASNEDSEWWRPGDRSWVMAILFAVGSMCFAVAATASHWISASRPAIGWTFFIGSLFFTGAGYIQYSEAVNVEHRPGPKGRRRRWRPASWEPRRIDWLASLVQFIGTILFNISTFAALNHDLTTHQANTRVWAPDVFGSIAFLIASELAFAEVCHRWISFRDRTISWWIAAINMVGSVAFGISAIASLTEPGTGEAVSARIANSGTALGGLCFLIGAVLLIPEAAAARRRRQLPRQAPPDRSSAARSGSR
jgi:uncharacterized membrane protein YgdD (TMEM256/DUF423 family)